MTGYVLKTSKLITNSIGAHVNRDMSKKKIRNHTEGMNTVIHSTMSQIIIDSNMLIIDNQPTVYNIISFEVMSQIFNNDNVIVEQGSASIKIQTFC
jgi:hypothetical protein